MLLAKGADREAKGDGETARQLAAKRGDTEVARVFGVMSDDRKSAEMVLASTGDRERSIAAAVGPALSLLEKQSHNFIRIGGCNSCHAQDLPSSAAAIARDRGLPVPREIPQLPQSMHALTPSRIMDLLVIAPSGIGWEMFDFATNHVPRDKYTDACVHYLKAMQTPEGNWRTFESRRPPMAAGGFQAAALAIFALKHYGLPDEKSDTDRSIANAVASASDYKTGEHAGPRVSADGIGVGRCEAGRYRGFREGTHRNAADGWGMESDEDDGLRRVRDRPGALRPELRRDTINSSRVR